MSFVQEQQKRLIYEQLKNNSSIKNQQLEEMVYACQTATGNNTGVGRIKGMLKFLQEGNNIQLIKEPETINIKNKYQLAELIFKTDKHLYLSNDQDFMEYF